MSVKHYLSVLVIVQVPKHACFLNFGFTDGKDWDEGYEVQVTPFKGFEGRPKEFYQEVRRASLKPRFCAKTKMQQKSTRLI